MNSALLNLLTPELLNSQTRIGWSEGEEGYEYKQFLCI
jgi:hypothetical protein